MKILYNNIWDIIKVEVIRYRLNIYKNENESNNKWIKYLKI